MELKSDTEHFFFFTFIDSIDFFFGVKFGSFY